jgi:hypothetical protein
MSAVHHHEWKKFFNRVQNYLMLLQLLLTLSGRAVAAKVHQPVSELGIPTNRNRR